MVLSDALGQYSLSAPAGTYRLQAIKQGSGYDNFSMNVTLADGDVLTQDITLGGTPPPPPPPPPPAGDAVVTGTTFNPSGTPVGGVSVRLRDNVAKQTVASTVSDAAGLYSLTAPAGTYRLQANTSGFANVSMDITLGDGETLSQDLTLRP